MLPYRALRLVRETGGITRSQLADRLGVSRPSITKAVGELRSANLVVEAQRMRSSGGRRAVVLRFNSQAFHVLGIDMGGTKTHAALANLDGRTLARSAVSTAQGSLDGLMASLRSIKDQLLAAAGVNPKTLLLTVIGSPGAFDEDTQELTLAPNLRTIEFKGLRDRIASELGCPAHIFNDVNLAALGERWQGEGQDLSDFVFIAIGTGLGAGIIANGALYTGSRGRAGELGYVRLNSGSEAAVEDVISGPGIARDHKALGGSGTAKDAFDEAARNVEPGAAAIARFIDRLSWLIGSLTNFCDPEAVILGGGVGVRCAEHLASIGTAVQRYTPMRPKVLPSALADEAGTYGAIWAAIILSEPFIAQQAGEAIRTTGSLEALKAFGDLRVPHKPKRSDPTPLRAAT